MSRSQVRNSLSCRNAFHIPKKEANKGVDEGTNIVLQANEGIKDQSVFDSFC
jgi:hypothetical protein